jgi:hypothetical protein
VGVSVACQGPGFHLEQVARGEQGGHLHGRARGRPVSIDDGGAGRTDREKVRGVGNEEGQLHHIAEAGTGRCQAAAQVLEDLPRLDGGIPGPV